MDRTVFEGNRTFCFTVGINLAAWELNFRGFSHLKWKKIPGGGPPDPRPRRSTPPPKEGGWYATGQTFTNNCFGKTSKKTHIMTFLCLQLYSFAKRKQEVPPQQRLLRATDLFCLIRAIAGILFRTNDVRLRGGRVEACSFEGKIGIFGLLRVVLHVFLVVSVTKQAGVPLDRLPAGCVSHHCVQLVGFVSGNGWRSRSTTYVVEPRLDDYGTILLFMILEWQPSPRLYECCRIVQEDLGIEISVSGPCRFLHRMGWSRKKLQVKALQRCLHYRLDFIQHVTRLAFPARSLVWLDECGCRCSCCLRNRGWAPLGVTPEEYRRFFRGRNVSCLTGVAADGVVALRILDGHVNGETFLHFCAEDLLPEMSLFGPDIPRRCAAMMDNASIHHVAQVQQLFVDVGVLLIFQPPYSPDFNVASLCFAFVKLYLAEHTHDFHLEDAPLPIFFAALRPAFNSITADLCSSWASHCGYDD